MKELIGLSLLALVLVAAGCGDDSDGNGDGANGGATTGGVSTGGASGGNSSGKGGSGGAASGGDAATGGEVGAGGSADGGEQALGGAGGAPSMDVTGHVYSAGFPVEGVAAIIGDVVTATDSDGAFTIPDVAEEYELTLISNEDKSAQIMRGLTSREVDIQMSLTVDQPRNASIDGQLSGGAGFPQPAGHSLTVWFVNEHFYQLSGDPVSGSDTAYTLSADWEGPEEETGKLIALQVHKVAGNPVDYTGFAEKSFTATDGEDYGNVDGSVAATNLALVDPDERTLEGSIDANGYTSLSGTVSFNVYSISFVQASLTAYSTVVPVDLPHPAILVMAGQKASGAMGYAYERAPASGDLDLTLPASPLPVLPIDEATGVDLQTQFTWTASEPNTISSLLFKTGEWYVTLYTTETSATIPDLSAYGIELPANEADCLWRVYSEGPADTVDEALALERSANADLGDHLQSFKFSQTQILSFTTAP